MKIALALILLCLISSSIHPLYADDILILEVKGAQRLKDHITLEEDELVEEKAQLIFDNDNGLFLFGNENGKILFKIDDIEKLKLIFEKYLRWEELAISNKVKINKDLPESVFATEIVYDKTSRGNYIKEKIHFKVSFCSVSETEHYLVIDSSRSENNAYSFLDEPFYIGKAEVQDFYKLIEEKNIEQYIKEYKNKEKIKELFK